MNNNSVDLLTRLKKFALNLFSILVFVFFVKALHVLSLFIDINLSLVSFFPL